MKVKEQIKGLGWLALIVPVFLAGYFLVDYLRNILGRKEFEKKAKELAEQLTKNKPNADISAVESEIRKQAYISSAMITQPGLFAGLFNVSLKKLAKLLGQWK